MKITILIMTVCLLQVSALTKAQISIDAKQESLREVLKKISQQSGYDFIYSVSDFKDAKPVDLKLYNVSLDLALRAAFYSQPLIYEVSDQTVMVRKKEEKTYIQTVIDRFQVIDVRGRVTGENGEPLAGATVKLKEAKNIVITDNFGGFYIKNVPSDAILIVASLGYENQEIPVDGRNELGDIKLQISNSKLDEIQVKAYGKTSMRFSTGNIATVSSETIEKQKNNNPLLSLLGQVAGVTVMQTSGISGGSPVNIRIRGKNALNGRGILKSSEPLYVIDGLPFTNNLPSLGRPNPEVFSGEKGSDISAFNFVNPDEIESISVLKDADATAIYGSRGANGVVLINTKKGKIGRTSLDMNTQTGWQDMPKRLQLLNTQQYLEMRREGFKNDGLTPGKDPSDFFAYAQDLTLWDQNRYTDWQEEFLGGTGRWTKATASISGGTENLQYRIGGNFNHSKTMLPGNDYDNQGNGHINLTFSSLDRKFKANVSSSYSSAKNFLASANLMSLAMSLPPNAPVLYNADGSLNWEPNPINGQQTWANPLAATQRNYTQKINNTYSNLDISYNIISTLFAKVTAGYNLLQGKAVTKMPGTQYSPLQQSQLGPFARSASFKDNGSKSWSIEPQLTYNRLIGGGIIDILLGTSIQNSSIESEAIDANGFISDAILGSMGSASSYYNVGNTSSEYKYNAIFGRVNYNYDQKYILNLTARRDGSSRFGPKKQFGNFGSLGSAWIFSEEKFIQKFLPVLNYGKLRVSYGITGNDGIPDYAFLELYEPVAEPFRGIRPLVSTGLYNPYYSWETTAKSEISLETGFFNSKLLLTSTYYRNRSYNQLSTYEYPYTAGYGKIYVNQPAKIQNAGWEFTLETKNIDGENLKWSTGGNISFERNKLLKTYPNPFAPAGVVNPDIGKPFFGATEAYIYKGVNPETGQYQFLGKDGNIGGSGLDSVINIFTSPKFYGGLTNRMSYKGFSLDVLFQFTKQLGKNYIFQFAQNVPPGTSLNNQPVAVFENRWRQNGDQAYYQKFTSFAGRESIRNDYNRAMNSDISWVDASFIRLQTLSLSYSLNKRICERIGVKSVRINLQGQNLFTITAYKGLDPEIQDINILPPLRVFTTGLQLTL